ncbi:possible rRNA methyltransferase SpoU family protein [Psychrobacter arcticus 273-4]|uniref:Possible rRNA methyltransferase SpoU family protein n=1 Tax=Psychrobacter arcticus (strain DSM 17307 / VKM B-2377 / 273-4) TaxID=259536 RepID=Q4FSH9_PSYA2|nr:RNA methyltransferase [Psychrobacter arcticus]AAZ19029.1 possible rRNA methyltransferase SpoU family protein [Psychrobacter arcticus 273-4]
MSNDTSSSLTTTVITKPSTVSDYLSSIQVVMVNTTLPANIGSAARAMHTMGLSRLTVVEPKLPIDATSVSHAAGGSDLLSSAIIAPTLEAAIADCQLVFAASSRSRHLPRPVVTPTQAAKIMLDFIDKQSAINERNDVNTAPNIAILFGREDRGLTNEELAYADYHIQIDANPAYPVLNVASAVQVIASFIFAYAQTHIKANSEANNNPLEVTDSLETLGQPMLNTYTRQQWDEPAITQQQLQQLTERTTALMVQHKLADSENLKSLPSRLSRLGSRIQLDQKEYQLISALIAKLAKD